LESGRNVQTGEFARLFDECAVSYLASSEGSDHLRRYASLREVARRNYDELCQQQDRDNLDWDRALRQLLPWNDNSANRARGAWIHVAPAINGDVRSWFERSGWTQPSDWPRIADAILRLVRTCVSAPEDLARACSEFTSLAYTKGFQSGMLSPILNALRPDDFLIVNGKSRAIINYFAQTSFTTQLAEYAGLNGAGRRLVQQMTPVMDEIAPGRARHDDLFDAFSHWLVAVKKFDFGSTGYWKIAPGEQGQAWWEWRDGGFAAIRWSELGDLTAVPYQEFARRRDESLPDHPDWTRGGIEQVWTFTQIQEGDRVVANNGTREVLGLGRVTGPYYFVPDEEFGHRLPVEWDDVRPRPVERGGWRRTLVKLSRSDYEQIFASESLSPPSARGAQRFDQRTFDLLEQLHRTPTAAFYQEHKAQFEEHVEGPMRALLLGAAERLSTEARDSLETRTRLFGRVTKNDYGRGGAWDYFWGALYPRGSRRIDAAQLFVWIDRSQLRFGFAIGELGGDAVATFRRRAREHAGWLQATIGERLAELRVRFDDGTDRTLGDWLLDGAVTSPEAAVGLPSAEVIPMAAEELQARVAEVFDALFPLVQLTLPGVQVLNRPTGLLGEVEQPETAPPYPMEELVKDTSVERGTLDAWVRSVHRRGQAIIYGPPGTGKTYVAQLLARHLVAETDGDVELVQFHPAFSYEDFVTGIRPTTENGSLTYAPQQGRFLDFCARAAKRTGISVLIIDEINRADLSRVLGELMYLLEYRGEQIRLADGTLFSIPEQVRVLGTMNTADRSIALVDHALRRRFAFLELRPNFATLQNYHATTGFPVRPLVDILERVNDAIGDSSYVLGVTYFLDDQLALNLPDIWRTEIEPYLAEFFFDRPERVDEFRWDMVRSDLGL
jgi:5-methylcytosine-specific restriction enzyme B